MSLSTILRSGVKSVVESAGSRLPAITRSGSRLVLAYHNVVLNRSKYAGDSSLHMLLNDFVRQMIILRACSDIVPLTDLLHTPNGRDRLTSITFDDAYLGALESAVRYCDSQSLPTCIFVAPSLLGSRPWWDTESDEGRWNATERDDFLWRLKGITPSGRANLRDDSLERRVATQQEIQTVLRACNTATIGNHSWSHSNLRAHSTEEAVLELRTAQQWIEQTFPDRTERVVAYPYGLAPREASKVLQQSNLVAGFLTRGGWIQRPELGDRAMIPRLNVPSGLSANGFRVRLSGWLRQ